MIESTPALRSRHYRPVRGAPRELQLTLKDFIHSYSYSHPTLYVVTLLRVKKNKTSRKAEHNGLIFVVWHHTQACRAVGGLKWPSMQEGVLSSHLKKGGLLAGRVGTARRASGLPAAPPTLDFASVSAFAHSFWGRRKFYPAALLYAKAAELLGTGSRPAAEALHPGPPGPHPPELDPDGSGKPTRRAASTSFWLRLGRAMVAVWSSTGAPSCLPRAADAFTHALEHPEASATQRALATRDLAEVHIFQGDLAKATALFKKLLYGRSPSGETAGQDGAPLEGVGAEMAVRWRGCARTLCWLSFGALAPLLPPLPLTLPPPLALLSPSCFLTCFVARLNRTRADAHALSARRPPVRAWALRRGRERRPILLCRGCGLRAESQVNARVRSCDA